ncbi:MAG: shikimate dehydrogenase [Bacteroidota bacterium]
MRKFGLIGASLEHSFSKKYFTEKFQKEGIIDCQYDLYELNPETNFREWLLNSGLEGVNVTIPYKEKVMDHLDQISDSAREIGAVNTIHIDNGSLKGHNTDALGFAKSIKPFFASHHERAMILGTGGASKAIKYVLDQLGVRCLRVSRAGSGMNQVAYEELHSEGMRFWPMIVNCTPLGTFPNVEECPNIPYEGITSQHFCVDLVYNPAETEFMKRSKAKGATVMNGLDMLIHQAEGAWKIWNS